MISINGNMVVVKRFPDKTPLIDVSDLDNDSLPNEVYIRWNYEGDEEIPILIYLTKHLQNHLVSNIHLAMPYVPNARQDRVKSNSDVFTLKYFAELINSLNFTSVTVFDPHSPVTGALFNNIVIKDPKKYIDMVIAWHRKESEVGLVAFFPDEGAMKRYSGLIELPYVFGIKKRDWKTGKILGLDVAGETDSIKGMDVLIIDDICSYGGTFFHSAQKLKEFGAGNIYLYVSHCEQSIFSGKIFGSGLIKRVFTTDTIMEKLSKDKIEVFKYE